MNKLEFLKSINDGETHQVSNSSTTSLFNRKLVTVLAAIALATGTSTVISTNSAQPVEAISKHTWHYHWIRLKKNKMIYRVNASAPRYRWHNIDAIELEKGSELRIRYFGNDNYYQIKSSDIEEHGTWIVRGGSANWFRNI